MNNTGECIKEVDLSNYVTKAETSIAYAEREHDDAVPSLDFVGTPSPWLLLPTIDTLSRGATFTTNGTVVDQIGRYFFTVDLSIRDETGSGNDVEFEIAGFGNGVQGGSVATFSSDRNDTNSISFSGIIDLDNGIEFDIRIRKVTGPDRTYNIERINLSLLEIYHP